MTNKFIITCALNGARRTKKDHPKLPITPEEIALCAGEIVEAGASIIHLHVRDDESRHSLDQERYEMAISAIRDQVGDDLIIQVTTESCGQYDREQQMALVKSLRPEAVSIALREICPGPQFIGETIKFFNWMSETGIFPQIILYDNRDADLFCALHTKKTFSTPCYVLLVLGSYSMTGKTQFEFPLCLTSFTSSPNIVWSVCCFGKGEYEAADFAAQMGGHVRVGFENNIWQPDGSLASGNDELVRHACLAGMKAGRHCADASDVRRLFGMN